MNFIILAFTACLASDPSHCQDRELTFSAQSVTLMQCTMGAHIPLAQWQVRHPKWEVQEYRCLMADQREVAI